ncbi:hypothetical protein [Allocoleopsis franciscana]|uniref:Uncharacterized protein n=1 Tax=Allocoleopsis franciscana PCC 7113 TaxID=1173027 RepID=K9WMJ4_9CYAN|nr:hypothetical protein [Allocoleopsis franciscana]AFZ21605.1 hypothetical protein Mic7113_6005 [Allocoleopsis franciscana PCC 7113]
MPVDEQVLEKILATHFCSTGMFDDDYDSFLKSRAKLILARAEELSQCDR